MSVSSSILSKIICEEYARNIRRNKEYIRKDGRLGKGMLIRILISEKQDYSRDKYLEILLFGSGYVTVLHREVNRTPKIISNRPWIKDSCHDSCWRGDGVEYVISKYSQEKDLNFIGDFIGWYELVDMSEKDQFILGHSDPRWETERMKDYEFVKKEADKLFKEE